MCRLALASKPQHRRRGAHGDVDDRVDGLALLDVPAAFVDVLALDPVRAPVPEVKSALHIERYKPGHVDTVIGATACRTKWRAYDFSQRACPLHSNGMAQIRCAWLRIAVENAYGHNDDRSASAAEEDVGTCCELRRGLGKSRVHAVVERQLRLYRLNLGGPTVVRPTGGHGDDIWQ